MTMGGGAAYQDRPTISYAPLIHRPLRAGRLLETA